MSKQASQGIGGVGFTGLLFLILLTLKLTGIVPVATWSWVWITAPLWVGVAALLAFLIGAFLVLMVREAWKSR